jgi:rubrerythrin
VEQTLGETNLLLESLRVEVKKNEQVHAEKVSKLFSDLKNERHARKLSEDLMKEMNSVIQTLQGEAKKKDSLQQSMESSVKDSIEQEKLRRSKAEQSLEQTRKQLTQNFLEMSKAHNDSQSWKNSINTHSWELKSQRVHSNIENHGKRLDDCLGRKTRELRGRNVHNETDRLEK